MNKQGINFFAIISIIVSAVGFVLSFALGFPFSLVIGPYVGLPFGVVGLILSIFAVKKKRSTLSAVALIMGIALPIVSVVRIFSFVSCVGGIISLFS